MGHQSEWRWNDGTNDPVDTAVRNVEPAQLRNPRTSDPLKHDPASRGPRPQLLISDELDVEINDPLQLMLDCEKLDEVAGCARGTHYDELCRMCREKLSK